MSASATYQPPAPTHPSLDAADQPTETLGRVLIVDDMEANLRLLSMILKVGGYEVETAPDGISALERLHGSATTTGNNGLPEANPLDIVLLDVMMPGMDGFEVCRRLRAHERTAHLPVIMVTALHESADRIQGLEAGADDFLNKPVDDVEVLARVKSLVRVKRQRDELEHAYRDLRHAESMRDNLSMMLVHDLRTPLTSMLGPLEMLHQEQFGALDTPQKEIIEICRRSSYRLLNLVNELLDIAKLENGDMVLERIPANYERIVADSVEQVTMMAGEHSVRIDQKISPHLPAVLVDDDLISRVLVNLLGNALRYSPAGSHVVIEIQSLPDSGAGVLFSIRDQGEGIPEEDQKRIFNKFGQVESRKEGRKYSTGLGLTFCRLAIEAHGGRIWVESAPGVGSTFHFIIPTST